MIKEPHDPGRSVAPITVTDFGFKKTSSSDFVGTGFSSLQTLTSSQKVSKAVTPANAGVQSRRGGMISLDSRFRGNDRTGK